MPVPPGWDGILKARAVSNQFSCLVDVKIGQLIHKAAENTQQNVNDILIRVLTEIEETKRRAYKSIVDSCSCESCTNANQRNQPCPLTLSLLGLQKATFTNCTHTYLDQCVQFYRAWDSSHALNQLSPAKTRILWPNVSHNQWKLFRVSSPICSITYVDGDGGGDVSLLLLNT